MAKANPGGKNSWTKGSGKKESKEREKGGKGDDTTCWICCKTRHITAWRRKGGNKHLYAFDEEDSEIVEEILDKDEELQARCLLEEGEHEQWQEVSSRRVKHRVKKANQASLLCVENSPYSNSKKNH